MTPKNLISGALLAGMLSMPAVAVPGGSGEVTNASPVTATARRPAQYCVGNDAATLDGLRRGSKRLVVVVRAFQPVVSGNSGLVASLLTANKGERHEVSRFAVHPLGAFSAQEAHRQQRFLVALGEHAHLLKSDKAVCIEIGFDNSHGKLREGRVEFHIELVDVMPAPGK